MIKLLKKNILHGRVICNEVINHYNSILPEVTISENIDIITVVDKSSFANASLRKVNIKNGEVNFLMVDKYIKWISKVKELYNYILNNYNELPDYLLYLDGTDTLIINDILNPKEMLDYYNCKVLFNAEPDFWHTGTQAPEDSPKFYKELQTTKAEYVIKNKEKYNLDRYYHQALNAGVFLGEKDFILKLLGECLELMNDDYHKGYPYGDTDDQLLLRHFHNIYFDDISIDLFHKWMFWGNHDSLKSEENMLSPDLLSQEMLQYENKILKNE
tara:strand:- start:947 stop:1762 length:816 start_codon:yes stop_codon:yes gene_type:complete